MSLTRRDFLAASAVAVAVGAVGRPSRARAWQQTPPPPPDPVFTPIRRNVGVYTCRGGAIGYLINSGGVVAVDSQYPPEAKLCVEGLQARSTRQSIDLLINTHHHADHTGGNGVFRPVTKKIVAHERVSELQKMANDLATTPVEQVYADTKFGKTWKTQIGDEMITATAFTPAHTGGDIVVHFEQANVVHVGDLVFNRVQAYVDRAGGASAVHWIKMAEDIAKKYPADAAYVFGHANAKFKVTGTRADVLVMRDYLTALVDFVRFQVKSGKTKEQVVAIRDLLKGFDDFGPLTSRALSGTFDEVRQ